MAAFHFQFWDDRQYRSYQPSEQDLLMKKLCEKPRPTQVDLFGGMYILCDFDRVEHGEAYQLKHATGFERHVRIQCPYALEGHTSAQIPPGGSFQYFDNGWHAYPVFLQRELQAYAQCAPPPRQLIFTSARRGYCVRGLDKFLSGPQSDMEQINLKTGHARKVRFHSASGAIPGSAAPSAVPPVPHVATAGRGMGQGGNGHGGYNAALSSAASTSSGHSSSSSSPSIFKVATEQGGRVEYHPVPQDIHQALVKAWQQNPRPQQFELPQFQGDPIDVAQFDKLEEDGANMRIQGQWLPLVLQLPLPWPGAVTLPNDLDVEEAPLTMFGHLLTTDAVARLEQLGDRGNECMICMDVMEAGDGGNNMCMPCFELTCGHAYHEECLQGWWNQKRRCPRCQRDFGKITGSQPRVGQMTWDLDQSLTLNGFPRGTPTIVINFDFPHGQDAAGTAYQGRRPRCYLPGNTWGILLLELFKVAFRRCVMFGLGNSMTFGTHRPTFNIHIKTSTHRGEARHGYPDDGYFARSMEELRTNGVTIADLQLSLTSP